ncbi:SCO2322 family protein [Streptomyces vilmorinianum]|uniref:SCO2322 family protein n=1 Tax=Streptomyces vilmorinianum TaxID=3051092 RepID=UPI0010FB6B2E|nr:SCO2322 family protein [Streptomyces vilmorinianum]
MRARVVGAAAGVVLTLAAASPAQAGGYRYWSFWESDGGGNWAYATQGPATARPADGDAIGFRFAVSEDTSDASRPGAAPDFTALCSGTERKAGTKRVAVVVDFGSAADAPQGETPPDPARKTGCAQVREDATAAEALAAVAKPLRYDSAALLCGIAGYPAKGCGEQVAETDSGANPTAAATVTATATKVADVDGDGGPSAGIVVGGAAVLALGGAAIWKARRRA